MPFGYGRYHIEISDRRLELLGEEKRRFLVEHRVGVDQIVYDVVLQALPVIEEAEVPRDPPYQSVNDQTLLIGIARKEMPDLREREGTEPHLTGTPAVERALHTQDLVLHDAHG